MSVMSVSSTGVSTTWQSWYSVASACVMPATSLPAIGWAGTKLGRRSRSTRRAASTTLPLVLPTSMNKVFGCTRWRIARSVSSVAATGTAISTMSAPDTAISADSAIWSMTPIFCAVITVDGDLL